MYIVHMKYHNIVKMPLSSVGSRCKSGKAHERSCKYYYPHKRGNRDVEIYQ